jgi:hypothetical protein
VKNDELDSVINALKPAMVAELADGAYERRPDAAQVRARAGKSTVSSRLVRERRPVRRLAFAIGATAAVAAAAVAVATQTGIHPVTLHTSPAAQSAKYADPLVERAAFGWLPRDMHANGYGVDHQGQGQFSVIAQKMGLSGKVGPSIALTAYEPGGEPALGYLPGGVPAKRIPAEPVNGHSAYWIYKPDPSGQSTFELRWKYAPNSWADLTGDFLRGSRKELTAMAYKVARSATFGGTRPIAMPLHVGGVPGGMKPKGVVLNNGAHGEVSAMLEYFVNGPTDELSLGVQKISRTTTLPKHFPNYVKPGHTVASTPNAKVDGHPAFQAPGVLWVYDVDGFDVRINASGSILAKLNRNGGLVGLFHRITIFGSDTANWTTTPVN